MPGLVSSHLVFFLEHGDFGAWASANEFEADSQADNPGADDGYVALPVTHGGHIFTKEV
jgi:hypothetical protein